MSVATGKDLAAAIGLTPGRISQLKKNAWFPKPPWDPVEVIELIAAHSQRSTSRARAQQAPRALAAPVASAPVRDDMGRLIAASVALCGRSLAHAERALRAAETDARFDPRALQSLKASLEEFRRTARAVVEMRERLGELIAYSDAEAAVGAVVTQAVQAGERLAGKLGPALVTLADEERWRVLPTASRVREVWTLAVREWDAVRAIVASEALATAGGEA